MPDRADVIASARSCLGTKFQHQGRLRGWGLDCLGLILWVAEQLGILDTSGVPIKCSDYRNYHSQPLDELLHTECKRRLIEKQDQSLLAAGDVVTMRFPKVITHGGIITNVNGELGIVHAYSGLNHKVIEHRMDHAWLKRIAGVFSFPGVTD